MCTREDKSALKLSPHLNKAFASLPLPLSGESEGAASGRSGGASLLQTARHIQRCSNGSEHRDNHINDCFPFFVFHKAIFLL